MAGLSSQIEELEREYEYERDRANAFANKIENLEDQIRDYEESLSWYNEFQKWVEATYPGAGVAFDAKRRLDEASVV